MFSLALIRVLLLICLAFVFCSKQGSSLSSARTQAPILPTLMQGSDDIFSMAMLPPKPSVQLGGITLKRRTAR
jgi:hypothetical protein